MSASYGITDRIDIGVLVPIEHTTASGSASSTLTILDIPAGLCLIAVTPDRKTTNCLFPPAGTSNVVVPEGLCSVGASTGFLTCPFSENNISGKSSGLGDIIVRGKFTLMSTPMMDLGAGVDLRNPTGNPDKLLGLPKPTLKVTVMGSSTFGMLAPHFNVGYTFAGKGLPFDSAGNLDLAQIYNLTGTPQSNPDYGKIMADPSDEVNYVFGADVAVNQNVTVMGDVIGRRLRHAATFEFVTQGASSVFTLTPGALNLVLGTVGTKIKIGNDGQRRVSAQ
jgi:hypothetical protein